MRKIYDLTHTIHPDMPVYPGTDQPKMHVPFSVEKDGFVETVMTIWSHTGTHMDAPAHLIKGAKTLDQFAVADFMGKAFVLDVTGAQSITLAMVQVHEETIAGCDFLLFYTGWDARWGDASYFDDFPTMTLEAARWLTGFSLKGVGVDAISIDPAGDLPLPVHDVILGAGMLSIENLTGLQQIAGMVVDFCCLPMKYQNADGAPIRAVASV